MESGPEFRIVGNASPETLDKSTDAIANAFSGTESLVENELLQILQANERQKTPEVSKIIKFANEYTNALMARYGQEPYDIPESNIYLVDHKTYSKIDGRGTAMARPQAQIIVINADKDFDKTTFSCFLIHELLHLKGHKSLQIEDAEDGSFSLSDYRMGVYIQSPQKNPDNHSHFDGLNEAIVATLEKRSLTAILQQSNLEEERQAYYSEETQGLFKKMREAGHRTDDIKKAKKDSKGWEISRIGYPRAREVFDYVVEQIYENEPNSYKNVEEVYSLFFDAHFSGHLLAIAKAVESAFGKGSFRILGNMNSDAQSAQTHLDTLKKLRRNVLGKNSNLNLKTKPLSE